MILYQWAREINKRRKARRKEQAGRVLSPVRRIEFVAPTKERLVGMTFDDGPAMIPPEPGAGGAPLTAALLDILARYGAHASFDIIGSTAENYPDKAGKLGSFTWGGMKFDHYPDFGRDELAGAVNCGPLIRRMIDEGHELANHGYRHIIFGPMRLVYGSRTCLRSLGEVLHDLRRLDHFIQDTYGYQIRLARPPHYIDRIPDGYTSYDAYKFMGYHYMASSFDGGGWIAGSGDYRADVQAMISPLKNALAADPEALNGKIIFQKDGYNMSKQTPIADALEPQLALLKQYGYRVVTVSELLAHSMFEDLPPDSVNYDYIRRLDQAGYCIGYQNNSFQPQRPVTKAELIVMTADPAAFRVDHGSPQGNVTLRQAIAGNRQLDFLPPAEEPVSPRELLNICDRLGIALEQTRFADQARLSRLEVMEAVGKIAQV